MLENRSLKVVSIRSVVLVMALATMLPSAAQDFSKVEVKGQHVAGTVHMLTGAGGNIGVCVGDDGVLIVDDQFAPLADKIQAAIGKAGGEAPQFILNTHWHLDHVGGNEVFGQQGTVVAHTNVRSRMKAGKPDAERPVQPAKPHALPVITFDQSLTVHFNEEVRAVHVPRAHTDGDTVVFFTDSNVVHMGDLFFADRFPFVDLDSGGNVAGLIVGLTGLLNEIPVDAKLIPGHGPLADRGDLVRYLNMIVETTEIVRKKMAAGQTLEQIQQAGLGDEWDDWSWGFIDTARWIQIVHDSYRVQM